MFPERAIRVLTRDHAADVARLNQRLSTRGTGTLVDIPPHTYVGRVQTRQTDTPCVLLLGINPMYSERPEHQAVNVHLPRRCLSAYKSTGDVAHLTDLFAFQEGYFLREERNKRHFGKFGHWFGRTWFQDTYGSGGQRGAQRVLDRHVIEMDVVQYFSKTASIDGEALLQAVHDDPALQDHWKLIEDVLQRVRPAWVHVHGKTCWPVMNALLMNHQGRLERPSASSKTDIMVGTGRVGTWSGPVLMHKFLGMSGPQKNEDKALIAEHWDSIRSQF